MNKNKKITINMDNFSCGIGFPTDSTADISCGRLRLRSHLFRNIKY